MSIQVLDWRDLKVSKLGRAEIAKLLPRADFDLTKAVEIVRPMLEDVRNRGVEALYEFAAKFDGIEQNPANGGRGIKVPPKELKRAYDELAPDLRDALEEAKRRITLVHTEQMPREYVTQVANGATVTQRFIPVERVGLYVPGGLAVYPSSVLMNAIPALCAGVKSICVATPPQARFDGLPHPTILAACYMLGVQEVVAIGGAGAIAALTYGVKSQVSSRPNAEFDSLALRRARAGCEASVSTTSEIANSAQGVEDTCEPVDLITGPGNIWVAAAKQCVQGTVGIDAVAGPSEIGIIADKYASPQFIAADLISQAEHDELAGAVLFTDSKKLVEKVQMALEERIALAKHQERIKTSLSGRQSGIILLNNLDECIQVANSYGAEHLEIQVGNPKALDNADVAADMPAGGVGAPALRPDIKNCEWRGFGGRAVTPPKNLGSKSESMISDFKNTASAVARRITNAGAIFVGPYSPVPLGDYIGGSNHVLPTGGLSRFSSGLSVYTFLRSVQQIEYSKDALSEVTDKLNLMSVDEDLPAHGQGALLRNLL